MNHDLENMVQALLGFAIICFVVIMFFYACFYLLSKKKNVNLSKHHFLGMLARFSPLEIFSLSLISIREIYFIWCLFQWKTTIVFLVALIIPGFLYNILNRKFINIIVDILNSGLLYVAIMAKNIFYVYTLEVAEMWHVILFIIMLIIFSLLYSLYFYFRNVKDIAGENMARLNKENKK